jgi:hypothetical protein
VPPCPDKPQLTRTTRGPGSAEAVQAAAASESGKVRNGTSTLPSGVQLDVGRDLGPDLGLGNGVRAAARDGHLGAAQERGGDGGVKSGERARSWTYLTSVPSSPRPLRARVRARPWKAASGDGSPGEVEHQAGQVSVQRGRECVGVPVARQGKGTRARGGRPVKARCGSVGPDAPLAVEAGTVIFGVPATRFTELTALLLDTISRLRVDEARGPQ